MFFLSPTPTVEQFFEKFLHLESVLDFLIFLTKSWNSLKKGLCLESVSNFFIFMKKSWSFLKKKFSLGVNLGFSITML